MKKLLGGVVLLALAGSLSACSVIETKPVEVVETIGERMGMKQVLPTPSSQTELTAHFEITTFGTQRTFSAAMYHNQSDDVYIEASDPSVVRVKRAGSTWDDFFSTLPFELTKDCLVTGTQQTYCSSEAVQLRFILNGEDTPNALKLPIQDGDYLEVRYN